MKKYIIIALVLLRGNIYGQGADSLSHYLEVAARNNPAVMAAFHAYEASLEKIPQAGAFQDPQLEAGFFLSPMELVEGRQIAQFQLMQMFPWFGTRKAARTEAQHMAQMAFEQFRETKDNLYFEVYTEWFILCSLRQKLRNTQQNVALLKQLEQLALMKFSTGTVAPGGSTSPTRESAPAAASTSSAMSMGMSASLSPSQPDNSMSSMSGAVGGMSGASSGMTEVLRIQLETVESESSLETLLSEIRTAKARFNALLNRPSDSEVIVPDTIAAIPFLLSDETIGLITGQNPMLGMIHEESLAYKAKAEMDRKMGYPMFGVGLQYMLIGKKPETDMSMNSMNGQDMIMPMVSVSIPVFRGKYKAARRESQLQRQASEARYTDALNRLQAEFYSLKHRLEDAERKIALYRKQSELAGTTYNLMVQGFASGKNALGEVITVARQLLDYQLKEAEITADYNTAVASIQRLISTDKY
ncbi:MAG: TolC family protein [Dysgonamonadaceae bacterium]|jgi:outer membrane protein TolC|nr:TolC family protein [Dysgonamonadaceae bacterium]